MNLNFTYIIPFSSTVNNINDLRRIIKWINGFKGSEIIVIEFGKESILNIISEAFKHIFVVSNKDNIINIPLSYNIGIKYSSNDVIICSNSFTYTNPSNILSSINMLDEYDVVKPYNKLIEVEGYNLSDLNYMDQNIHGPIIGNDYSDDRTVDFSSGILIFKKESLLKIGGWEEKFNMGFYEEFQTIKIKKMCKWIENNGKGYVIKHNKLHNDNLMTHDLNLLNTFKTMDDSKLLNYVRTTYSGIGLKNKYE